MVVPATFGGPMHSKFRVVCQSLLFSALVACGQGVPTAPPSTVAAPAAATEGSGSGAAKIEPSPTQRVCGVEERHSQHGDGIYAVRYLSGERSPTPLVGFSLVKNLAQCPNPAPGTEIDPGRGGCEVMNWMVLKQQGNPEGKFPINRDKQGLAYCYLGDASAVSDFRERGREFAKEELGLMNHCLTGDPSIKSHGLHFSGEINRKKASREKANDWWKENKLADF